MQVIAQSGVLELLSAACSSLESHLATIQSAEAVHTANSQQQCQILQQVSAQVQAEAQSAESRLMDEADALKQQLIQKQHMEQLLRDDLSHAQQQLADQGKMLGPTQQELADTSDALAHLQQTVPQLNEALSQAISDKSAADQQLADALSKAQADNAMWAQQEQQIAVLQHMVDAAAEQLSARQATIATLENQVLRLSEQLALTQAEVNRLEEVSGASQSAVEEANQQLQTAQFALDQQQQELVMTQQHVKNVESQLRDNLLAHEQDQQQLHVAQSALQDLQLQTEGKGSFLADLQQHLAAKSSELAAAAQQMQQLQDSNAELQQELADKDETGDLLQAKAHQLAQDLTAAKSELAIVREALATKQQDMSQLVSCLDQSSSLSSSLLAEWDAQVQQQLANYHGVLADKDEMLARKDLLLQQLQHEVAQQHQVVAECQTDKQAVMDALNGKQLEVTELLEQLAAAVADVQQHDAAAQLLASEVNELQNLAQHQDVSGLAARLLQAAANVETLEEASHGAARDREGLFTDVTQALLAAEQQATESQPPARHSLNENELQALCYQVAEHQSEIRKAMVLDKQASVDSLSAQVAEQQEQIQHLTSLLSDKQTITDQALAQLTALQQAVADAETAVDAVSHHTALAQLLAAQHTDTEAAIASTIEQAGDVGAQVDFAQQHSGYREEQGVLLTSTAELQVQLTMKDELLAQKQQQWDSILQQLDGAQQQLIQSNDQLAAESMAVHTLTEQLMAVAGTVEQLETSYDVLVNKLAVDAKVLSAMSAQLEALAADSTAKAASLSQEASMLQAVLSGRDGQISSLEQQLDTMHAQLATRDSDVAELQSHLVLLHAKVDAKHAEVCRLTEELQAASQQLTQHQISMVNTAAAAVQSESVAHELQADLHAANDQCAQLTAQVDEYKQKLRAAIKKGQRIDGDKKQLQAQVEELTQQLAHTADQLQQQTTAVALKDAEIKALWAAHLEAPSAVAGHRTQVEQMVGPCSTSNNDSQSQQAAQQQLEQQQQEHDDEELVALRNQLQEAVRQLNDTIDSLHLTQQQLHTAREQVSHDEQQLRLLKEELAVSDVKVKEYRDELHHTQQQLHLTTQELQLSDSKVEEYRDKLRAAVKKGKAIEVQKKLLEAQLSELQVHAVSPTVASAAATGELSAACASTEPVAGNTAEDQTSSNGRLGLLVEQMEETPKTPGIPSDMLKSDQGLGEKTSPGSCISSHTIAAATQQLSWPPGTMTQLDDGQARGSDTSTTGIDMTAEEAAVVQSHQHITQHDTEALAAQLLAAAADHAGLQQQLSDACTEKHQLQMQLSSLIAERKNVCTQMVQLQSALEAVYAQASLLPDLQHQLISISQDTASLNQQNSEVVTENAALQQQLDVTRQTVMDNARQVSALQSDADSMAAQLTASHTAQQQAHQLAESTQLQLAELRLQLEHYQSLVADADQVRAQLADMRVACEQLQQQMVEQEAEAMKLCGVVMDAHEQLGAVKAEKEAVQVQLQQYMDNNSKHHRELERLAAEVESKEALIAQLQQQYAAVVAEQQVLAEQLQQQRDVNQQHVTDTALLQQQLDEAAAQVQAASDELTGTKEQAKTDQAKLQRARDTIMKLRNERSSLSEQIEHLEGTISSLQATQAAVETGDTMQAAVAVAASNGDEQLRQSLAAAEDECKLLKLGMHELQSKVEALEQQLKDAGNEQQLLLSQLSEAVLDGQQAKDTMSSLQLDLTSLQQQLKDQTEAVAAAAGSSDPAAGTIAVASDSSFRHVLAALSAIQSYAGSMAAKAEGAAGLPMDGIAEQQLQLNAAVAHLTAPGCTAEVPDTAQLAIWLWGVLQFLDQAMATAHTRLQQQHAANLTATEHMQARIAALESEKEGLVHQVVDMRQNQSSTFSLQSIKGSSAPHGEPSRARSASVTSADGTTATAVTSQRPVSAETEPAPAPEATQHLLLPSHVPSDASGARSSAVLSSSAQSMVVRRDRSMAREQAGSAAALLDIEGGSVLAGGSSNMIGATTLDDDDDREDIRRMQLELRPLSSLRFVRAAPRRIQQAAVLLDGAIAAAGHFFSSRPLPRLALLAYVVLLHLMVLWVKASCGHLPHSAVPTLAAAVTAPSAGATAGLGSAVAGAGSGTGKAAGPVVGT